MGTDEGMGLIGLIGPIEGMRGDNGTIEGMRGGNGTIEGMGHIGLMRLIEEMRGWKVATRGTKMVKGFGTESAALRYSE